MTVLVALVSCLAVGAAAAQEAPDRLDHARREFDAGSAAFESGDLVRALAHFETAYDIMGSPDVLYNIAVIAERLGMFDRALEAYRICLLSAGEAERANIEARIARVEELRAPPAAEPSPPAEPDPPAEEERPSVVRTWWFWTIVAAVAIAGGVAIGIAVASQDPGVEPPITPVGGVVWTLGGP